MVSKRGNIDPDYVEGSQLKEDTKNPPPKPWPLPTFEPLNDLNWWDLGGANLPEEVDIESPESLFDLFFTSEVIEHLVDSTNCNAIRLRKQQEEQGKHIPSWRKVLFHEMIGYISILIWAACFQVRYMRLL